MSIGYKHRGSDGPLYHPERDFAYITPTLMKQAIENMTAPPNPDVEVWKKENNITEAEIVAAAEALADAQRDFVNSADPVTSLQQAMHRYGYFDLRMPVRLLLEAMVGEVMIGAWFKAVREITQVNSESPAQNEMCRFASTVREFAARQGALNIDGNVTAEVVLMRDDVMRSKLTAAYAELKEAREAQISAENKATRLEIELARVPSVALRVAQWFSGK
jgi:hypothetical protein